jgi:hypothetical protein
MYLQGGKKKMNSYDNVVIPNGIKKAYTWTLDGTFYSDDIRLVCRDFAVIPGKEFYTMNDDNGNHIAAAVVRWN